MPGELPGRRTGFRTRQRFKSSNNDTTKQTYFQADYNASFTAGGFHTLKVGDGMRHNANDVDQRYPGGRVHVYWDSTFTSSVPGVGSGRGTYGYYAVDDLGTFGEASRQHLPLLRAGSVERRQI